MDKRNGFFRLVGFSLVTVFILSSCSAAITTVAPATQAASSSPLNQGGSSTEAATNTPVPATMAAPMATTAPTPTATTAETATPTVQTVAQVVPTLNAYCRKGPGAAYDQLTILQKGIGYNVIGRDSLNTWWLIQASGNVKCWVGEANVGKQGPVDQASIVQAPPLPATPAQFVSSFVCHITLKTLGVSFNWAEVQNVTGYRIYRNGSKLTEVGLVTSYHDDAPLGVDLVYELEAFNAYGVAARISTNVPACK